VDEVVGTNAQRLAVADPDLGDADTVVAEVGHLAGRNTRCDLHHLGAPARDQHLRERDAVA
jgi:hypothetical protein